MLTALRDSIATRLTGDTYYSTPIEIPVLTESHGDIETAIRKRLQTAGILIFIFIPRVQPSPDLRYSLDVHLVLDIIERPRLNTSAHGTGKPGIDIGMHTYASLAEWAPSEVWTPLEIQDLQQLDVDQPEDEREDLTFVFRLIAKTHTVLTVTP